MYGKLTTIKVIILSFRRFYSRIQCISLFGIDNLMNFAIYNSDSRLLNLVIIDKFTIKIHMALEKYIKITLFLLNMKYLRNILMLDNDFLAGGMLIRNNLLGVYLRKCLILYD